VTRVFGRLIIDYFMEIILSKIHIFIVVFVRISMIIVLLPIFGYFLIPIKVKISLAALLTLLIVPLLPVQHLPEPQNLIALVYMIGREAIAGLIIGFATTIMFMAFQFAGTIVGLQMGFGIVNVLDPQSNIQVSIIGQFMYIIALLIFLAIDGHYFLIQALVHSFKMIPLTGAMFSGKLLNKFIEMSAQVFIIAVKIGIPMIVTLTLTDVALGIIARTVPQMNIFIVSFPLKIGLGLFALASFLPLLLYMLKKLLDVFQQDVTTIIKLLAPGA
jgi:flagellar biosynthetic protein FliR